jgi:hypothetical protein
VRRAVFLDTGYLLALIRKKDACHEAAHAASAKYTGSFVTTDLVLVEFANSLSQPPYRATAVAAIEKMGADGNTRIIPFDAEGMKRAFALYKGRPDKAWGLVDCFSFVVMKEERIKVALSFDEHFKQAGFEVPLLSR